MPPVIPQDLDLENADKWTAVLTGAAALLGAILAAVRWPIRYAGVQLHRYYGGLAWKDELDAARGIGATVQRLEPKVDALTGNVERIEADVRMLVQKLIPDHAPVAAPPKGYRPPSRDEVRR